MKTVLITEDNPDILENIKEILELAHFSAIVASGYIKKPFDPEELIEVVDSLVKN